MSWLASRPDHWWLVHVKLLITSLDRRLIDDSSVNTTSQTLTVDNSAYCFVAMGMNTDAARTPLGPTRCFRM